MLQANTKKRKHKTTTCGEQANNNTRRQQTEGGMKTRLNQSQTMRQELTAEVCETG